MKYLLSEKLRTWEHVGTLEPPGLTFSDRRRTLWSGGKEEVTRDGAGKAPHHGAPVRAFSALCSILGLRAQAAWQIRPWLSPGKKAFSCTFAFACLLPSTLKTPSLQWLPTSWEYVPCHVHMAFKFVHQTSLATLRAFLRTWAVRSSV